MLRQHEIKYPELLRLLTFWYIYCYGNCHVFIDFYALAFHG